MMELRELENLYRGKRAFIVGNGPSLRVTPLDRLRDEYSFGMNRLTDLYCLTTWRPTFYVCVSSDLDHAPRDEMFESAKPALAFLTRKHAGPGQIPLDPDQEEWSDDPTERVSKFGTGMLAVMQLAVYMGFNPLYLVGCDLGFGPDGNHYADDYPLTPAFDWEQENVNQVEAHRRAKYACDRLGIEVYNATIGGKLEVYPRVSLLAVLEGTLEGLVTPNNRPVRKGKR